ncbi:hypothetical protein HED60_03510 [Planctomycetales bacterium ZRK34]|nr:hypothetical protein HED60_03510 [Planctomycetales bacterium ZRK34]
MKTISFKQFALGVAMAVAMNLAAWAQSATAPGSPGTAPQADRDAILAMAGCYDIEFNFKETVAMKSGYKLTKPYIEDATEWVQVIVNEPNHIVLQHLLIDTHSDAVIKHWRQEWCYQERELLEFRDRNTWVKRTLSEDEARGTWTQKVYQTDDSPRYQGYGKWVHTANMSLWESNPTRRPLPRREYTKRDDYQALRAINRHIITPAGWVHEQDNTKLVCDEHGKVVETIARETGLNRYLRTDDAKGEPARKWWAQRGKTWSEVCDVWNEIYDASPVLKLQAKVDDKPLSRTLAKQVYKLSEKDVAPDQVRQQVRATIDTYIVRGS